MDLADRFVLHFTYCPSCGSSHQLNGDELGHILWCSCGRLLRTRDGTAEIIRPPEAVLLPAAPAGKLRCFACDRFWPAESLSSVEVPSEAWVPNSPIGTEETLSLVVLACRHCLRPEDYLLP